MDDSNKAERDVDIGADATPHAQSAQPAIISEATLDETRVKGDLAWALKLHPSKESQERLEYSVPTATPRAEDELPTVPPGIGDAWRWSSERHEHEFDRRSRELDRRERELERRERELERRQREFDYDKARWLTEVRSGPHWQEAIDALRNRLEMDILAERKKVADREAALESKIMEKVNETLEKERQLYGVIRMSDNEVNEMVENSVGYLLQNDEDIADRVRFQSLLYLSQERLASEAGLEPASGSGSLAVAWRVALGPSVATEDRYNKSLELLKDRQLNEDTKKLMANKAAMEYVVEYTSHLRKEGSEMGDHSFAPGRIAREDYMESVRRQANHAGVDYDALTMLIDFICPK